MTKADKGNMMILLTREGKKDGRICKKTGVWEVMKKLITEVMKETRNRIDKWGGPTKPIMKNI